MPFPRRSFISNMSRAIQSKRIGDPSQPETSEEPGQIAEEAAEDELDALTADVFGAREPSQDSDAEQAFSPHSSEEGEASTRPPLGSESSDRRETEAASGSPESSSPSLSPAHIDYHAKPEEQLTAESQGLPEDPANSPREASPDLMSVEDKLSESLKDIFQKKVVSDPLMKALLEIHGDVDIRRLAAELGEFATNIGAGKHRKLL